MKFFFITLIFFLLQNCSKPKTVLICGDHICINKTEANQFFEENLSIEVRIIDKNNKDEIDLVELNLTNTPQKKISIKSKDKTKKLVKNLSNDEIKKIKNKLKEKKKIKNQQKFVKKVVNKNSKKMKKKQTKKAKIMQKMKIDSYEKKADKQTEKIVDVCSIIDKCSIDEISKFLLKKGKNKKFPDITIRE